MGMQLLACTTLLPGPASLPACSQQPTLDLSICPASPMQVATGGSSHQQLPMVLRVPHASLGSNPAFAILGLGESCSASCRVHMHMVVGAEPRVVAVGRVLVGAGGAAWVQLALQWLLPPLHPIPVDGCRGYTW